MSNEQFIQRVQETYGENLRNQTTPSWIPTGETQ